VPDQPIPSQFDPYRLDVDRNTILVRAGIASPNTSLPQPPFAACHAVAVPVAAPTAHLPADAAEDIAYVNRCFRPMDESVRALVEREILPQATYVLPDGTPMVPADHAALLDDADGQPEAVASRFRERFLAAGGDPAEASEEHEAWLSGEYGACLYSTAPESIVAKSTLMTAIGALLASPAREHARWCTALRGAVDALDALERPFARYDRERFGGPCSRDRLITQTHQRFPDLWT
jgi:hypothetical protein